jgi:two-component system OmpR family sensor kinase
MKQRWLLIALPLGLGLVAGILLDMGQLLHAILVLRVDLLVIVIAASLLLAIGIAAGIAIHGSRSRMREQGMHTAQAQAAADRRRFLSQLDHELKNPLTALHAGIANLAEMTDETGRKAALESIGAQTLRLSRLASDLRKVTEVETRPLEYVAVDLCALLQEVLASTRERPATAERRIMLTVPQAPWPLPSIQADQDLLFLALHNLVDNALKFTQPDATVEVRAIEDGATVVIEIADTGPGIPDVDQPYVWDELYRSAATRGVPGNGLGLALVRAIVARHKGQVALRSRVGQGTVVTLRLAIGHAASAA